MSEHVFIRATNKSLDIYVFTDVALPVDPYSGLQVNPIRNEGKNMIPAMQKAIPQMRYSKKKKRPKYFIKS